MTEAPSTPVLSLDSLGPRFDAFVAALVRPVVFFDIEATGTDPNADRIVELSIVRVNPQIGRAHV